MEQQVTKPYQTCPNGLQESLINELSEKTGRTIIGNIPASGTVIIDELGKEHMASGALIVYTSAASVLQIAAHEDIVPLDGLCHAGEVARDLTSAEIFLVGRLIASPP